MERNIVVRLWLIGLIVVLVLLAGALEIVGVLPDTVMDGMAVVACTVAVVRALWAILSFLPNKGKVGRLVFDAGRTVSAWAVTCGFVWFGIGALRLLTLHLTFARITLALAYVLLGVSFVLRGIYRFQIREGGLLSSRGTWRWQEIKAYDWVPYGGKEECDNLEFTVQRRFTYTESILVSSEHRKAIREHLKGYLPGKALS